VAQAQLSLAPCLVALGRKAEAEALMTQARGVLARELGAGDPRVKEIDAKLAALRRPVERKDRAPAR
jgi:hypothetical protein